ncbi:MAG: histidine phosphatase family protein [Anaerolineae bacterium]|nr:histidine phosphatase family protein [Anaerolineae bacterium]
MTELILVRHGQSYANVAGRWDGWSEDELTPLGRKQSEALAERLASEYGGEVAALYTSPLNRALQTAQIIGAALGLPPITVENLKEINFGELSGITLERMAREHPALFSRWKDRSDMEFQWPGGEKRGDFFRRVARACDAIILKHPHERVIVVAHGGTVRACLAYLLPDQLAQWWGYELANCGLTVVTVEEGRARLITLNDKTHLSTGETGYG